MPSFSYQLFRALYPGHDSRGLHPNRSLDYCAPHLKDRDAEHKEGRVMGPRSHGVTQAPLLPCELWAARATPTGCSVSNHPRGLAPVGGTSPYVLLRHIDHRSWGAGGPGEAGLPHTVLPWVALEEEAMCPL